MGPREAKLAERQGQGAQTGTSIVSLLTKTWAVPGLFTHTARSKHGTSACREGPASAGGRGACENAWAAIVRIAERLCGRALSGLGAGLHVPEAPAACPSSPRAHP